MIFLRRDRSQHLSETGPNQSVPNPSARPVPTPQRNQSQPLNETGPNSSIWSFFAGINPTSSAGLDPTLQWDQSQPLIGFGPNPSAWLVPTPQQDRSQPLNMIPTPQQDRSKPLNGTSPNPSIWSFLDRIDLYTSAWLDPTRLYQPLSGTCHNPSTGLVPTHQYYLSSPVSIPTPQRLHAINGGRI